ncbi:hypothetical protein LSTR_LSTR016990 [Laodelphax striatellus]|uniref:Uncharacterized protein n=1 Tax=Laodelphax striatellus TaxID=195883 RepID=A0A482WRN5_LAOST|nr:hypothetical protein LSTR_LSTR016990 [Laodelphax striatellus]
MTDEPVLFTTAPFSNGRALFWQNENGDRPLDFSQSIPSSHFDVARREFLFFFCDPPAFKSSQCSLLTGYVALDSFPRL